MYRKENIKIMKYNKNDDIVDMLNNIINLEDISKAELARRIGISPQGLNAIFTKKNINLDDIKRIADALGYDIEINLKTRDPKIRLAAIKAREMTKNATKFDLGDLKFNNPVILTAIIEDVFDVINKSEIRKKQEEEKTRKELVEIIKAYDSKQTEETENEKKETPAPGANEPLEARASKGEASKGIADGAPKEAEQSEADGMESEEMK